MQARDLKRRRVASAGPATGPRHHESEPDTDQGSTLDVPEEAAHEATSSTGAAASDQVALSATKQCISGSSLLAPQASACIMHTVSWHAGCRPYNHGFMCKLVLLLNNVLQVSLTGMMLPTFLLPRSHVPVLEVCWVGPPELGTACHKVLLQCYSTMER